MASASGSEDSEDEPLSILAALKKRDNYSGLEITPINKPDDANKKSIKIDSVSIALQRLNEAQPVVERPLDVWLYFTDFSPTGPYSCLLCSEWFINRTRIVIHYVVDHKKDYCGICRYFVPNREAWQVHLQFHLPLKCSQCLQSFTSETELREHLSNIHNLVHCRLCHLRLPDDAQYQNHLQKHSVKDVVSVNEPILWDLQYKGSQKFQCLLCLKSIEVGRQFADHFMSYHHLTLRCFMHFISGYDLPFNIKGVDLTPDFIETQLSAYSSYGYVDFVKTIKVKEEVIQDENALTANCYTDLKAASADSYEDSKFIEEMKGYRGDDDFDITRVELIVMHQCYFEYVNETLNEINSNIMPPSSNIIYVNSDNEPDVNCCLCEYVCKALTTLETHMTKAHGVKTLPIYWCRVCAAVFDSLTELEAHATEELSEFEDLWICQFCDKEFDNREDTRKHLTVHWSEIDYDNCFSPHLGFKCKFCPILFWNETDRELHHVKAHYQMLKSDFYKCMSCGEIFGDKVFFIHHCLDKHNVAKSQYLLKCCICCMVLQTVEEMRAHFGSEHPKAQKVYCSMDKCKFKPFCHRKSFFAHLRSVHFPSNQPNRKYTCKTCGEMFASAKARSVHVTLTHGPGKFQCNLCKELLRTSDERKFHYLIRHPGRFEYQCTECNKSFQYKSSLYMHKQEHAPNKTSYACNYCGKVFLKRDSYREHILIHQAPRHACSYCPMRFVQRSNMLRHERRHTGERPYSCKFCPRTFADKGACTSHLRTHLKNTPYSCVYCGQTFVQKSKLTYHIRKHTGENLETCTICSKTFTSACSLREHMRVHQRQKMQKTIKCPLCDNMYSEERMMLRHMRATHTGAKYKCPLCRKVVTSASSLRDHVVTHSRIKTYQCTICPKSYHAKKSMIRHVQKRHGIKKSEVKSNYRHLEPKDCNLGLDDDLMDKIFGNPRRRQTPGGLLADFVTYDNSVNVRSNKREEKVNLSEAETQREENREINNIHSIQVKVEPCDDDDDGDNGDDDGGDNDDDDDREEIPPPDFVNVKIEAVEENDLSDSEMA